MWFLKGTEVTDVLITCECHSSECIDVIFHREANRKVSKRFGQFCGLEKLHLSNHVFPTKCFTTSTDVINLSCFSIYSDMYFFYYSTQHFSPQVIITWVHLFSFLKYLHPKTQLQTQAVVGNVRITKKQKTKKPTNVPIIA